MRTDPDNLWKDRISVKHKFGRYEASKSELQFENWNLPQEWFAVLGLTTFMLRCMVKLMQTLISSLMRYLALRTIIDGWFWVYNRWKAVASHRSH